MPVAVSVLEVTLCDGSTRTEFPNQRSNFSNMLGDSFDDVLRPSIVMATHAPRATFGNTNLGSVSGRTRGFGLEQTDLDHDVLRQSVARNWNWW